MSTTQNYKNHVRWFPLVHFILEPLLGLYLIWQIVRLYQEPSWDRGENLMVAAALIVLSFAARLQALKVQDRVIRLEESLRYNRLLTGDVAEKAATLPIGQIIALRFASDDELSSLVQRTLDGEFKTNKEIKLAVKNWRGDFLRA